MTRMTSLTTFSLLFFVPTLLFTTSLASHQWSSKREVFSPCDYCLDLFGACQIGCNETLAPAIPRPSELCDSYEKEAKEECEVFTAAYGDHLYINLSCGSNRVFAGERWTAELPMTFSSADGYCKYISVCTAATYHSPFYTSRGFCLRCKEVAREALKTVVDIPLETFHRALSIFLCRTLKTEGTSADDCLSDMYSKLQEAGEDAEPDKLDMESACVYFGTCEESRGTTYVHHYRYPPVKHSPYESPGSETYTYHESTTYRYPYGRYRPSWQQPVPIEPPAKPKEEPAEEKHKKKHKHKKGKKKEHHRKHSTKHEEEEEAAVISVEETVEASPISEPEVHEIEMALEPYWESEPSLSSPLPMESESEELEEAEPSFELELYFPPVAPTEPEVEYLEETAEYSAPSSIGGESLASLAPIIYYQVEAPYSYEETLASLPEAEEIESGDLEEEYVATESVIEGEYFEYVGTGYYQPTVKQTEAESSTGDLDEGSYDKDFGEHDVGEWYHQIELVLEEEYAAESLVAESPVESIDASKNQDHGVNKFKFGRMESEENELDIDLDAGFATELGEHIQAAFSDMNMDDIVHEILSGEMKNLDDLYSGVESEADSEPRFFGRFKVPEHNREGFPLENAFEQLFQI